MKNFNQSSKQNRRLSGVVWILNLEKKINPLLHDMGLAKQFVQAFLKILQSFGILASAKLLAGVMQMDTRQELEPGVDSWPDKCFLCDSG